jgi:acyl carrier protein phosphodiesterase
MNYLAHALLSPDDPVVLMGNLWGDLLRPRDFDQVEERILKGVEIHRRIDAYTDQHAKVDQLVHLIRPYQGKYTPVVADVLMDFMLSKYWKNFHHGSVQEFCQHKYDVVSTHLHRIPERLHFRINRMLDNKWLESCIDRERMKTTLLMLSHRASFENKIMDAMRPYELHEEKMDGLFLEFFVDLKNYVSLQSAS